MKNKSCLVIFSGGQDSTTCLFWAKQIFKDVKALTINYKQRHQIEIESAKKITELAEVEHIIFETDLLSNIGNSALLNNDEDINANHNSSSDMPASFVPGRNLLFLTIAATIAFKYNIKNIVTGVCQTDYSGYPDCRDNFIKSANLTLNLATDRQFQIHTPLMWLTKAQEVELAFNIPGCREALTYSHTCYNGEVPPCGKCPSCILRATGFKEAGRVDPLISRWGTDNE